MQPSRAFNTVAFCTKQEIASISIVREHRSYQKRDIFYWEQKKSLVAKNAVRNFTAEGLQTLSTQQVDAQESQQPEGNSGSLASNSCQQNSESYTLSDLKKLQKNELAAIFELKLGEPPYKRKKKGGHHFRYNGMAKWSCHYFKDFA